MRAIFNPFLSVLLTISILSCGKGGGNSPDPNPPAEAPLAVVTDPAVNAVQPPAPAPYTVKVTVTSAMPANGIKIEVTARKDDGSGASPFFTNTLNTSSAASTINITGTPANTQCLVEVKVTSRSTASNTWTGSYRFSSK
ncbi:MAG: hypothetical protein KA821_06295 [Chitinophagaceae bacterium]|nr:hypothetical protein [Chitinophagaceae bacterium]